MFCILFNFQTRSRVVVNVTTINSVVRIIYFCSYIRMGIAYGT